MKMRDMMRLVEALHRPGNGAPAEQPYIDAHRVGAHKIEIEMMSVPKAQRGKGVGRRFYEQWEAELPPDIHVVQIWSADTGTGNARGFWESMGFEYRYSNPDDWPVDEDTMDWMVIDLRLTPNRGIATKDTHGATLDRPASRVE